MILFCDQLGTCSFRCPSPPRKVTASESRMFWMVSSTSRVEDDGEDSRCWTRRDKYDTLCVGSVDGAGSVMLYSLGRRQKHSLRPLPPPFHHSPTVDHSKFSLSYFLVGSPFIHINVASFARSTQRLLAHPSSYKHIPLLRPMRASCVTHKNEDPETRKETAAAGMSFSHCIVAHLCLASRRYRGARHSDT